MQNVKSFTPAALNATGLASAVATVFTTLNTYALTATSAADGMAHIITFAGKAATNYSGRTVVVTGTDADGNPQTDSFIGPNGVATVSSAKYFLTVTSITMSGATSGADTFDIGWTAVSVGQTVGLEQWAVSPAVVSVTITGTINMSIQETAESFRNLPQQNGFWVAPTATSGKSTSFNANLSQSMRCARASVASVTAGATMRIVTGQGVR